MRLKIVWACALFAVASFLVGCGKSGGEGQTATTQPAAEQATYKPTGDEGSIAGKVSFQGEAPKLKPLSLDADSVCVSKHKEPVYPETVVTNGNGTLRNVFVYVKSGLEGKSFPVPQDPVTIDQNGCMYKPHVLGIQARQTLKVVSSDDTTHNIHPMPKVNREWNVSQPPKADPITQTFSRPEVSIPVKCNQHPWMKAYINVVDHPFYAVTGDDGTFEIKGLPPGAYTLESVHERYGAQTQQVTVAARQKASADFAYNLAQSYRPSSLTTAPALVLACCGEK
jgi:plastocyanin